MRDKGKANYYERRVQKLEEELKQAKAAVKALEMENRGLKEDALARSKQWEKDRQEHLSSIEACRKAAAEAVEMRKKYEALTAQCAASYREYKKQMQGLLAEAEKANRRLNT